MARINIEDFCEDEISDRVIATVIECLVAKDALGSSLRNRFAADMADLIEIYDRHVALVESPIERAFIDALFALAPKHGLPIERLHYELTEIKPDLYLPSEALFLYPQFKLSFVSNYRVDFLLLTRDRKRRDGLRRLVVECDGHDFHERTKEQAQRDKSRDRDMLANGFTVMRFTGSEIHADAQRCAEEALRYLGRYT